MGAIQGAINSLIGSAGAGASAAKAVKLTQEQAAQRAMQSAQAEIDYKIKQQELKISKYANRQIKLRKAIKEGGTTR